MIDTIDASTGPDWAAIAPYIKARQAEIAARSGDAPGTQGTTGAGQRNSAAAVVAASKAEKTEGTGKKDIAKPEDAAQSSDTLSEDEQAVVEKLKARDREVRAHEQAHAVVGGAYASAPSYSYQQGPDGNRYAIGGEVQIDVSPIPNDPEATILKMQIVKAAALAPAEPSSADRQVAAFADAQRGQAMAELTAQRGAERRGEVDLRV